MKRVPKLKNEKLEDAKKILDELKINYNEDIEKEYEKVLAMGVKIIEGPTKRPWGAINMSFYDPDNNMIFFRSFPKNS